MQRFQPVFLVDKKFYQVLVYDPELKDDVLVDFGDQNSINITHQLLQGDEKTIILREEYLKKNPNNEEPTNPEYWVGRYIWLSGDDYVFDPAYKGETLNAPVFPAPLAKDPVLSYPVLIDNSYYPSYPDYSPYYSSYYPYSTYYPAPGYGYNSRYYSPGYGTTAVVAGLTGLAIGGLLGSSFGGNYGGYNNYNRGGNYGGYNNYNRGGNYSSYNRGGGGHQHSGVRHR